MLQVASYGESKSKRLISWAIAAMGTLHSGGDRGACKYYNSLKVSFN